MSDRECWAWIRVHPRPKKQSPLEICFTGFPPVEKEELCGLAEALGFRVRTRVTENLHILCVGDNPGPVKLQEAKTQGATIIPVDDFLNCVVIKEDDEDEEVHTNQEPAPKQEPREGPANKAESVLPDETVPLPKNDKKIWIGITTPVTGVICLIVGASWKYGSASALGLLFLYVTPVFIAHARAHQKTWEITVLSLLLGWTVIGWVGALVWALSKLKKESQATS